MLTFASFNITVMRKVKNKKSKYNFHQLELGSIISVKVDDMLSMSNALSAFNKRNGSDIELEPENKDLTINFIRNK